MSFLPRAVDGKTHASRSRPGRDQAMDRQDDWRSWESCACDETQAAASGWETESQARTDDAVSDARASGEQGRIMVIGFTVIRI